MQLDLSSEAVTEMLYSLLETSWKYFDTEPARKNIVVFRAGCKSSMLASAFLEYLQYSAYCQTFFPLIIIPELMSCQLKKKKTQRNLLFSEHLTHSKCSKTQNKKIWMYALKKATASTSISTRPYKSAFLHAGVTRCLVFN